MGEPTEELAADRPVRDALAGALREVFKHPGAWYAADYWTDKANNLLEAFIKQRLRLAKASPHQDDKGGGG